DHTTNIAESVQYIIAGYTLPSERTRSVVSGML
ncbi:MAG: hypothetical protein QOI40_3927, partial [Alphaproteobacteria bacterium]|nr:hypothetical protein [Alphaproteobacteria bacterium]